jgi:outer membrane protein OmpA-like peptidoglycan-associated protein
MSKFPGAVLLAGALLLGGCATKKYVQQQVQPVSQKVDAVDTKLGKTQEQVDNQEKEISAVSETAKSADSKADIAGQKADAIPGKMDRMRSQMTGEVNAALGNLDDYKPAAQASVSFETNKSDLSDEAMAAIDAMVQQHEAGVKRYFITLEGHADPRGAAGRNLELTRKRAESVQRYLISKANVPVFRIQLVGMGAEKAMAGEKPTKDDLAKDRRVDLTLYTAAAPTMASGQ